jgi:ATP-dependent helicase HrpA
MREWEDIHEQLIRVMRELEIPPNAQPGSADQIHRALLPGLLSKIGMWNQEARVYLGARQTRFLIHPSSGLGKKPPPWVMAAELVETSRLFARTVPSSIRVAREGREFFCRRSYGDPHWEQKAAQVVAREQVTLYGLPIVKNRAVPYARYDQALCRELFITHALVRYEYATGACS